MKTTSLFFLKDSTPIKTIKVEIAETAIEQNRGLQLRKSLPENTGMLFIYEHEQPLAFWMKDTYIPLDIIYINESLEIVSIIENATPLNETPLPSTAPAKYVVEVAAGFCAANNITLGDKIKF
jgi:hypothetical protein